MTPSGTRWYAALMLRYVLLGLLRDGTPRHGYALIKEYRRRTGVRLSTGNFYRELQRLVSEGLVQASVRSQDCDPRQTPYVTTAKGRGVFDAWLVSIDPPTGAFHQEDRLSARVLFLTQTEPEVARRMIARWQDDLWVRAKLVEREREDESTTRRPGELPVLSLLLGRRNKHLAADLSFLEDARLAYEQWVAGARGPADAAHGATRDRGSTGVGPPPCPPEEASRPPRTAPAGPRHKLPLR